MQGEDAQNHEEGLAMRASLLFLVVMGLLLIFQSSALLTLSYDLPPGQISESAVTFCEWWHGVMQDLGPAEFTASISDWIEQPHEQTIG